MLTGYYVMRRSLNLKEEFGPTEKEGVSLIPNGIAFINEIRYSWLGRGNEGDGSWSINVNGEEAICEIYPKGSTRTVIVKSSLKDLSNHLYSTTEEAAKEP
jgi:hypothetical protein